VRYNVRWYSEKNEVKVFFFEKFVEMLDGILGLIWGTGNT
jgi:hypothetical protein